MKNPVTVVRESTALLRRYQKYIFLLLLSAIFVYILNGSFVMVKGKVIDYFNDNQYLLAEQASIGLKDLFLRYFGELTFLAQMDGVIEMNDKGRGLIRNFLKMAGEDVMGLTRVNEGGIIVFTAPDETAIGSDIGYQKHIAYILKEKKPVLSDVFLAVQNFKTVAYHVPVFDQDGGFKGSLALLINFERIARKFIDKIDTGDDCNAWIMSQNGIVLYAKNIGMLDTDENDVFKADSCASLKKAMLSGRDGVVAYRCFSTGKTGGKPVRSWAAFYPLSIENTFWSIAVSTPEPVILSTMAMIEKRWLLLLFIVGIGGLILIHSVIRSRTLHMERKKREKIIRELEWERNFTHKALDSQLDTFFVYDVKNGKAVRWNQSFHHLCGYSDREIGAMKLPFCFCSKEDEERSMEVVARVLRGGAGRIEVTMISKDGRKVPMEYHVSALNSESGEPEYLIAVGRDVTERKQAETAILENERLGVIGEMAAAIAHDFNNSLQIILGNLDLISRGKNLSEEVHRRLNVIRRVSSDAAVRVQMIQRMGAKREDRSGYTPVDINNLLRDIVVSTRPLWKDSMEKNGRVIHIRTEFENDLRVMGNSAELRAVFHNVIKNSIEALPDGGDILISSDSQERFVRITVKDNGCGMDEETKQRVFQPFFSTKGFELGRGLGLSGAYSIVHEHGGEIRIMESRPGAGTVVEIKIPSCTETPGSSEETVAALEMGYEALGILWVDDEAMIREVGQDMMTQLGTRADFARDGVEALDLLRKNRYDLVITDVGMPGMNGLELAQKIRESYDGRMMIAIVTGWGDTMDDVAEKKPFFDFFMQKPISVEQIQTLLRDAGISLKKRSDCISEPC